MGNSFVNIHQNSAFSLFHKTILQKREKKVVLQLHGVEWGRKTTLSGIKTERCDIKCLLLFTKEQAMQLQSLISVRSLALSGHF